MLEFVDIPIAKRLMTSF